jgi:phosphodiesterase/alkaline phosphatase D-like protein
MKRREFIRLGGFLTVSAAAIGMTGCDPVGDSSDTSASALDPTLYPTPERPMPVAAAGAGWAFPQSVASADPKADSIVLWTRVLENTAADTDVATTDVAVTLRVTAADNSGSLGSNTALTGTLVAEVAVPAYADYDGTIRHKLTGLAAGTTYYYQFQAGAVLSNVGRFKTAPAASATGNVKFAFMACQDWGTNHWGVFEDIVARDATDSLDFIVHLGDYIYETDNGGAASLETRHGVITFPDGVAVPPAKAGDPAPGGNYASTTNDYRYLYKLYRSDLRLQAVHERFAIIAVWDDHEFSDDCWMNLETYSNQNTVQNDRRRNANQSWFEYMPADVEFQEVNPNFQNIQLYRDIRYGKTVHLVMTDERLYKQDHMIPENAISPVSGQELGRTFSRYLAPEATVKYAATLKDAGQPDMSLVTMLGSTQRQWWKDTMEGSDATWKVWGNEVSLLRMGLNGAKAIGTLVALQTLQGTKAKMEGSLTDANVMGIPKAYAGALSAASAGVDPTVAIPAAFAILQTYAATANAGQAIAAGVAAGLNETQATNALGAIGAKTPTSQEIGICAVTVVAATQMYMTSGILQATAKLLGAGATVAAMLADTVAGGTATDEDLKTALKGTNPANGTDILDSDETDVVLACYNAAKTYAAAGQTTQVTAGAGMFATTVAAGETLPTALLSIRAEIEANKTNSAYVKASGQEATLGAFLRKFLINADQWDGYALERQNLMKFLAERTTPIKNVVAVTGDIHAFYACEIHVDPDDLSGAPALVEYVTAGISSSPAQEITAGVVASNAAFTALADLVPQFDPILTETSLEYRYANSLGHGVSIAEIDGAEVRVTFLEIADVKTPTWDGSLTRKTFRTRAGSARVEEV